MIKYDFKMTPQIKRYIVEMVEYFNECKQQGLLSNQVQDFETPFKLRTQLNGEGFNSEDEVNNIYNFIKWLEDNNIIVSYKEEGFFAEGIEGEAPIWPTYLIMQIRDISLLLKKQKEYAFSKSQLMQESIKENFAISFNKEKGSFFYKNQEILIDEKGNYFKTLVCVYKTSNGVGPSSINKVAECLNKNYRLKTNRQKIQDAVSWFRKKLSEQTNEKIPLLTKWIKGKANGGFIFNNIEL